MTKPLRTALAAALVAAFATSVAVQAQTAPTPPAAAASTMPMQGHGQGQGHADGHGHRHGAKDPKEMMARWQARHDQRMAELKKDLQLTPTQEAAWTQFTNAMRPPASMPQRPDREAMARLTTPERIDQMQALHKQRQAEMDRRAEATKAFYASLTPDQKKKFDAQTARHMGGRHHGGQGGHGGPGHHGHHG
jgi:Spy/CpxP family protein refolding chaperone